MVVYLQGRRSGLRGTGDMEGSGDDAHNKMSGCCAWRGSGAAFPSGDLIGDRFNVKTGLLY